MSKPPRTSIWAAGGVLYRIRAKKPEFLLVHREQYDDWSLPKGKVEGKESFLEAAMREVDEETGHTFTEPRPIGTIGYETPRGNAKVVRWWLVRAAGGSFTANGEVDAAEWLPRRAALKRLSYEGERGVMERAATMVSSKRSGVIYLVRHALAGVKAEWKKQDWFRPLDRDGVRQAKRIHLAMEPRPVTRIISSHYKRCVDTVRPLAMAEGIDLEKEKALGAKGDPDTVVAMFRRLERESAVVCTHGEIIGDVIGKLAADGVPLDGPAEWRKGSIWVLETRKGKVRGGRYIEPL